MTLFGAESLRQKINFHCFAFFQSTGLSQMAFSSSQAYSM